MEAIWKVCFACKRTTQHVQLKDKNLSKCTVCSAVRDDQRTRERMPCYENRGIGILCDDGTRCHSFPILID